MPDPLDGAPELSPMEDAVWEAYKWLVRWSDGMGGLDRGALREYFSEHEPGSRLEPEARGAIFRYVPVLIAEDRAMQREEMEQRRREAENAAKTKTRR